MPKVSELQSTPALASGDLVYVVADGVSSKLASLRVANIAAMVAILVPKNGMSVEVTEDGRGGLFVFDTSLTADGDDGTTFKATDATVGSWSRRFDGSADPRWWGHTVVGSTLTIRIPSEAPSLQAAFDRAYARVGLAQTVFLIDAGHSLASGLLCENGDFSHIIISSDDATVPVTPGFTYVFSAHVFKFEHCSAPIVNVLINMTGVTAPGVADDYMIRCRNAKAQINSGKGITHSPTNGAGFFSSHIRAEGCVFDDAAIAGIRASNGGTLQLRAAKTRRCGKNGLSLSSCHANANEAVATDNGDGETAGNLASHNIRVESGAVVHLRGADARNGNGAGLYVDAAFCAARDILASGCQKGVWAKSGSHVDVANANCSGATQEGVRAEGASHVDCAGANVQTCTIAGVRALTGSHINAPSVVCTGSGTYGVRAEQGAFINVHGATCRRGAENAAADISISQGSIISSGTPVNGGVSQAVNTLHPAGVIFQNV